MIGSLLCVMQCEKHRVKQTEVCSSRCMVFALKELTPCIGERHISTFPCDNTMDQVSCRVTITPWSPTTHLEARVPMLSPFKPELNPFSLEQKCLPPPSSFIKAPDGRTRVDGYDSPLIDS